LPSAAAPAAGVVPLTVQGFGGFDACCLVNDGALKLLLLPLLPPLLSVGLLDAFRQ
jgi:hypothetical protein